MNKTISMKVNQENLVKSLRFSFTNRSTVLGELMQNARRAGASHISFDYDESQAILTVTDDGCGINDINALLTIAESGWDSGLMANEHPFGMGFLSAMYACDHLTLISKCGCLMTTTADALSFKTLTIDTSVDWHDITTLVLTSFVLNASELHDKLRLLAEGFPIHVFFNGADLERLAAFNSVEQHNSCGLTFSQTEIGWVHLRCMNNSRSIPVDHCDFKVYLQGLPIYQTSTYFSHPRHFHLIHLDSTRFYARLPDRNQLIDEVDAVSSIKEVLGQRVRQRMTELKTILSPEQFVSTFNTLRIWNCLDLLNDVNVLPKEVLSMFNSYPVSDTTYHGTFLQSPEQVVTRSAIETGQVEVVDIDDEMHCDGAARFMFVWQRTCLIYQGNLDEGHWLHAWVRHLSTEEVTIELINISHSASFHGDWVWVDVTFCDAYRITIGNDSVEISDHAYYQGSDHNDTVVLPRGEQSAMVLEQVATFRNEHDEYQEAIHDADAYAFDAFVVANTSLDPADALERLLPEFSGCPSLFGKAFMVAIDDDGKVASVITA